MTFVGREINSQPVVWRAAAALAASAPLPSAQDRVAFFGCGSSWFIAQAAAAMREACGAGESDAFPAAEMPLGRPYDAAVALSRSGTTAEVLSATRSLRGSVPVIAVTASADTPLAAIASRTVALPFADEQSVMQTRFATAALALLRASFGLDLSEAIADAGVALNEPLPLDPAEVRQLVFLGQGFGVGLAREAALKVREAAQAWSEAHPALEYRHGPICAAGPGTVVWSLGELPPGLRDEITASGSAVVEASGDPMAELVRVQRFAVALAQARGLDPDQPRNPTRSVVLDGGG